MSCFVMLFVHLFVEGEFPAQFANHVPSAVPIFNVFGEERIQNRFLAVWTFGALMFRCNVIVKELLCVETVHAL